ncbi:MAG TPA: hypothetical protein VG816_06255, partial [Solirubrobacterales bacterium]|nr:hypothetical protein [Solirubrobacterales bacterium]
MRRLIAAIALLGAAILPVSPAQAAEPAGAPAWTISIVPYPTAFEAGSVAVPPATPPGYQLHVFNVGGAPTAGEFKIVDTLPAALKPSPSLPITGVYGPESLHQKLSCSTTGHTVTCTGGKTTPLEPGQEASVVIPLEVQAGAPATVLDKALVEGGGGGPIVVSQATKVSAEASPFGFVSGSGGLFGSVTDASGTASTQAGSHPYQATVAGFYLNTNLAPNDSLLAPGGGLHEIKVDLPRGEVVNPQATHRCTESQLESGLANSKCPLGTQVGVVWLTLSVTEGLGEGIEPHALYNMVPPPGHPAEFAFEVISGIFVHFLASVSSDGNFELSSTTSDIPAVKTIAGVRTLLWGDPSAESHDVQRGEGCLNGGFGGEKKAEEEELPPVCRLGERSHKPFLALPSSCGGSLTTTAHIDSWIEPGNFITRSYESADLGGHKVGVDGCNQLQFEPTIEARPTTNLADSPSGLDFDLHQPQNEEFEGLATANLKDITVALPQGMALNPSAGGGRDGCSSAQIGLSTAIGATPIRFSEAGAHCPDAAKIGSVEVKTPLLENPLEGAVYLAKPFDNPFGTLLGIYLSIDDPQTGVIAKLPGKVEADPSTGQLTTTFQESPELPLEDVTLHLFNGPRAALTTPQTCGAYTTTASLTPWSTPEGATVGKEDSFETTTSPSGGSCPRNGGEAPNKPAFSAGTIAPQAGAYSPFVLHVSREDGSQRIAGIDTSLPEGLTGKLAGIPYCPESGIAQALSRTHNGDGALEQQSPSCPPSSEVGTADIAAGSGITPLHTAAKVYLAGPYKGAPLSVVVITPAVAGPFDLGVVTTRVALDVDPETAE